MTTENSNPPRTPVTYWTTLEQLQGDPEVARLKGEEFFEKPALHFDAEAEALKQHGRAPHPLLEAAGFVELTVKNNGGGEGDLSRRDFLKLSAAAAAFATAGCGLRPTQKIIPYVKAPEEITPGVPNYYASTLLDAQGTGVLVKTREGRPIKLEGNPDHPLSQGRLSVQGQAEIFNLYDPDRLNGPVKVTPGDRPQVSTLSWAVANDEIGKALTAAQGRVAVLTGTIHGPARTRVWREFTQAFGGKHYTFDAWNHDTTRKAQELCYGTAVLPRYHFDKADYFLMLGADPLGTGYSSLEWQVDFGKTRKVKDGKISKLVVFEPFMTLTGANADERFRVKPEQLYPVALALAAEVQQIVADWWKKHNVHGIPVVTESAHEHGATPVDLRPLAGDIASTEHNAGLPAGSIHRLATELCQQGSKKLVMAGEDLQLQILANYINARLRSEDYIVDGTISPSQQSQGSFDDMLSLIAEMNAGKVDVLILYDTNPLYTLPPSARFAEALTKVKTVVYLGDRVDETGRQSHYVLPGLHFLENWGDAEPQVGLYSLTQPSIFPLYDNRAAEDSLLAFAKAAQAGAIGSFTGGWHEYLMDTWRTQIHATGDYDSSFEDFFTSALRDGIVKSGELQRLELLHREFHTFRNEALSFLHAPQVVAGELELVVYPSPTLGDGRHANNAWLLEATDPVSKICWTNYASLSPATAEKLGLSEGSVVTLEAAGHSVEIPVHLQPGDTDDVVSVQSGWGRKHVGKVGNDVGVDAFPFRQLVNGALVSSGIPCTVKATGAQITLPTPQGHSYIEGRPILYETTLAAWQQNPRAGHEHMEAHGETHVESESADSTAAVPPSLWKGWEYPGNRWGMVIDPTSCIGCNACVLACQVENNIPVVGAEQVIKGREMHWIRIDRYYSGPVDEPDVTFQPMLCQHCENAPCETVCPVIATLHNDEGLNLQIYNRCVGTRYCSNNCPYKVRRFNWHEYAFTAYGEHPLQLGLNPEVTVREKGVMEKCTFCVHRIRHAKHRATQYGRLVDDSDMQTACQQTCPTDAIVFGNINHPDSRVKAQMKDERSYYVLEELNTRPSIAYYTKLRNRAGETPEHGAGGAHS